MIKTDVTLSYATYLTQMIQKSYLQTTTYSKGIVMLKLNLSKNLNQL